MPQDEYRRELLVNGDPVSIRLSDEVDEITQDSCGNRIVKFRSREPHTLVYSKLQELIDDGWAMYGSRL